MRLLGGALRLRALSVNVLACKRARVNASQAIHIYGDDLGTVWHGASSKAFDTTCSTEQMSYDLFPKSILRERVRAGFEPEVLCGSEGKNKAQALAPRAVARNGVTYVDVYVVRHGTTLARTLILTHQSILS
jgi:hypothetical protein